MKKVNKIEWQKQCYGCTEAQLEDAVKDAWENHFTDAGLMAMSILSDAQELIERDRKEEARQLINRVKWIISEKLWNPLDYNKRIEKRVEKELKT